MHKVECLEHWDGSELATRSELGKWSMIGIGIDNVMKTCSSRIYIRKLVIENKKTTFQAKAKGVDRASISIPITKNCVNLTFATKSLNYR